MRPERDLAARVNRTPVGSIIAGTVTAIQAGSGAPRTATVSVDGVSFTNVPLLSTVENLKSGGIWLLKLRGGQLVGLANHEQTAINEERVYVLNSSDSTTDYLRVIANANQELKLVSNTNDMVVANTENLGTSESLQLDGVNQEIRLMINDLYGFTLTQTRCLLNRPLDIAQAYSSESLALSIDSAGGQPYISFNNRNAGGTVVRKGYIGYPQATDSASEIRVFSDNGNVTLWANGAKAFEVYDPAISGATNTALPGPWNDTTATSTNQLRLAGSGGRVMMVSSSLRFKKDFEPIDSPTSKLMALAPIFFRSTLPVDEGRSFYGFGAEQVAAVDRRFAAYDDDEIEEVPLPPGEEGPPERRVVPIDRRAPVGLDHSALLATAIATIQEQQLIINDLQARVESLESAI